MHSKQHNTDRESVLTVRIAPYFTSTLPFISVAHMECVPIPNWHWLLHSTHTATQFNIYDFCCNCMYGCYCSILLCCAVLCVACVRRSIVPFEMFNVNGHTHMNEWMNEWIWYCLLAHIWIGVYIFISFMPHIFISAPTYRPVSFTQPHTHTYKEEVKKPIPFKWFIMCAEFELNVLVV